MEEKQSQCLRFYTRKRKKNMSDLTTTSDKLMALPESLLHLILSFLDMKQVVQTSCLSTKWRNIWKFVPVLNFSFLSLMKKTEISNPSHRKECMDIVEHILFRHNGSSIQKIKLFYFLDYDIGQVDALLLFVVEQQVKEVQLRIRPSEDYHQLPHLLFTSVIEVFTLKILDPVNSVQLPNSMCSATQLRILNLENIILPRGDINGELVISCPILDQMLLNRCSHHDLKLLSICAPQLDNLVILNCHADSCKIKICTPNLTSLILILSCYKDYSLESLSSLVTANIDVSKLATKFLMSTFNALHNAITLTISGFRQETSPGCGDLLDQGLNTCSNLKCLEFYGFLPGVRYITSLLKQFPHIETLIFKCCYIEDKEEDREEVLSTQTMFSHLKYITVSMFNGFENEVNLLEYLLKTAPGLQSMTITSHPTLFAESQEFDEITEKLHSLPRAASSSIILIT